MRLCRLLLAVATTGGVLSAAPATPEQSLPALARTYRNVDRAQAVAAVALRSRESVEKEVERLVPQLSRAGLAPTATRLAAVALLTESALADLAAGDFERVRWQLQSAARLVKTAPPAERDSRFDRLFHLVAGLALHCGGHLEPAHSLLLDGSTVAGDDPELFTALGAVIETVAALRDYDPSPDSERRGSRPGGYSSEAGGAGALPRASLDDAEAYYLRALRLDPALAEARLRLGRVRLLRGRPQDAIGDLGQAAAGAREPSQRYLARLFEGRARETLGDLRGAAEAHRAATDHVPHAQTGLLALSRALDRLGDGPGAQEALARAMRAGGPEDPWLDYQVGQPARLAALFDELLRLLP